MSKNEDNKDTSHKRTFSEEYIGCEKPIFHEIREARSFQRNFGSKYVPDLSFAVESKLTEFVAVSFINKNDDEPKIYTSEEVAATLSEVRISEQEEIASRFRNALEKRTSNFENHYKHQNSFQVIESGEWAGFTLGDALAWSDNILTFETGERFGHTVVDQRTLTTGNLVKYVSAERAKELVALGMTPASYRQSKLDNLMLDNRYPANWVLV
ncbi:MAG: hypothetical protein KF916_04605 [Microbacteriaceae bacterium]|nr:hypothetical protein [Microbacteriaceae bacterium]